MHGIIFAVLIVIIAICCGEIRKWWIKRKLRYFVSPKQVPILGVANRFLGKSNDQLIQIIFDIYEEVKTTPIQVWFGPFLAVGVSEPHDVQVILTNEHCLNKPFFYDQLHCKSSIIATDRDVWKNDRRALNVAFDVKVLQNYIPLMNDKSRILIQKMEPFLKQPGNIYRAIFICTMDTITKTTMGTEMNIQLIRGQYIYGIFKQIMENIQYRACRLWLHTDFIYALSSVGRKEKQPIRIGNGLIEDGYVVKKRELQCQRNSIASHRSDSENGEKRPRNVMEQCIRLEEDGIFTHENVMDQLRLVMFAGTDTLSITVFGTLLMLALNPKHQELVVDELRSIFESADCDVTHSHIINMKYTERVIKETQRLLTPVPFIGRRTTANVKLEKGTIPKNTIVFINIMNMHRSPKIWGENVMEFDPDRFLPENVAKRPPFSFIPFSSGPRNCLGMKYAIISAKLTLAHLLRRYKFTTKLKFDDIRLKTHLVLEVSNDKPLEIEDRRF